MRVRRPLSSRSVLSRRLGNPFTFGSPNGGFGSTGFGSGNQGNHGNPVGGGDKGSALPSGSKNLCPGFSCSLPPPPPPPPPPHTSTKPNAGASSRTSEETPTAPVGGSNPPPLPSPTLDAGFNTTLDTGSDTTSVNESNTSSVSTTASASPSSDSQAVAGSTNSGQNSDTANGQTGSISSPILPGQEPTSFNPSGLPFGADPTGVDGVGVAPSNTASAGSGSGIGSTSAATSQGPDVGAIAGGVIGSISFIFLLLFIIWLVRRRRKNRTAPSAEFLSNFQYPFSGNSSQFQFARNSDFQCDIHPQSPTNARGDTPRSFLHLREKSDSS